MERREKDGSGGGGGGKERDLSLVDVYDIAADIGKVSSGREQKGDKLWCFSPHCVTPALEGNESNDG